jgi:hypothetical protein
VHSFVKNIFLFYFYISPVIQYLVGSFLVLRLNIHIYTVLGIYIPTWFILDQYLVHTWSICGPYMAPIYDPLFLQGPYMVTKSYKRALYVHGPHLVHS